MGSAMENPLTAYNILVLNNHISFSSTDMDYLLAGVTLLAVRLREIDRCILEQWEIKPIQPDYGVLTFVPMIMPMP
jgi:hypothetical protein